MIDDGGPAYPGEEEGQTGGVYRFSGMTLRDAYAMHAPEVPPEFFDGLFRDPVFERRERMAQISADWAYSYADAMIARRKQ